MENNVVPVGKALQERLGAAFSKSRLLWISYGLVLVGLTIAVAVEWVFASTFSGPGYIVGSTGAMLLLIGTWLLILCLVLYHNKMRWIEVAPMLVFFAGLMFVTAFGSPFKRYMPPRGLSSLDELVAARPVTLKYAEVEKGKQQYIVWIGRASGASRSGPPVCVFDDRGRLVDWVGDAGDSDNRFVGELYGAAFRGPTITAEEALARTRSKVNPNPRPPGRTDNDPNRYSYRPLLAELSLRQYEVIALPLSCAA